MPNIPYKFKKEIKVLEESRMLENLEFRKSSNHQGVYDTQKYLMCLNKPLGGSRISRGLMYNSINLDSGNSD